MRQSTLEEFEADEAKWLADMIALLRAQSADRLARRRADPERWWDTTKYPRNAMKERIEGAAK